jgi:hypothetical protein
VEHSEWEQKYSKLIAKAWMDERFKKRFLENPAAVLKEEGLEAPYGVEVKVVESTDKVLYLVLPHNPIGELSEQELARYVAASPAYTWCHWCKVD